MSSHREAPEISKDPVADNTDTYAFVSPDKPDTITIITNYIPLQGPDAGPNFFEFGTDVLYEIHIDNDQDADSDIVYQFRFRTETRNPNSFLYNTGQIKAIDSPNWNRPQFYSVTRIDENGNAKVLGRDLLCPPCNVGFRSTPDYPHLAAQAIHELSDGVTVFAGQRADGFYADLGSIFDLLDLRPFSQLHLIKGANEPGVNGLKNLNVQTIAIQIPKKDLTPDRSNPTDPKSPKSVIGVYGSASRRKVRVLDSQDLDESGPFVQISRLGNPLFNEVIVPLGQKDYWNRQKPKSDEQFTKYVANPELAGLIPVLYPGVFPHLAELNAKKTKRADLIAILLTGLPSGIISGFQNYTGSTQADLLRLNMAIAPAKAPNINGILGGDLAGFPNGRRVFDDVVTIELRAVAGLTYPLIDPTFKPDAATSQVTDGVTPKSADLEYLSHFPYLNNPYDGFSHPSN
ncbi:MAG: DUF4331 domain-containing protein [Ktedonobacteraceae bacterium]